LIARAHVFGSATGHRRAVSLTLRRAWLFAGLLLIASCRSVGPPTVARDRFDYSTAISDSWKRQNLLNIVKLRYLDPPIFVDVGQIVSGYTIESGGNGTVSFPGEGPTAFTLGAAGKFTDRPTVTYVPMTGSKFISSLLTPLPPTSLFNAIQAGWPADAILMLGASNINGLNGESNGVAGAAAADPRFLRVMQLMRNLQLSGLVSIRIVDNEEKRQTTLITLRADPLPEEFTAQAAELRTLLGLDPNATEFRLVYGSVPANNREVAITTRSLIRVLGMLAAHVKLPPADVAEGRAMAGVTDDDLRGVCFYSGPHAPPDAFVAVRYRNLWFWIDDRDLLTKRAFMLIMLLFTMADPGTGNGMPVLTIPTG
jgi:hypothetical protein